MKSTVATTAVLALLVVLISCAVHAQQQQVVYQIVPQRINLNDPLGVNDVTLTCRLIGGDTFDNGNAVFWVNSTANLRFIGNPDSKMITIDNKTEGEYLCGESEGIMISNKVSVIPHPQYDSTLEAASTRVVTVRAGQIAELPPYIGPGVWHSRYHIDWKKNGSQNLIARVDGLRTLSPFSQDERYTISGDFSLRIESVTRSDEGDYVGQLGVREASGSAEKTYEQTGNKVIKLNVYEPPVITSKPEESVISFNSDVRQEVSFSCTAEGYPRPTIKWLHNTKPIPTTTDHNVVDTMMGEDTIQSTITLRDVNPEHSGKISCNATVTPGGGQATESAVEVADLSVLKINIANVHKTVDNDLIFVVHLAKMVPAELQIKLIIQGNRNPIIVNTTFQNNDRFSHFLTSPRFDTSDFKVYVSVFNAKSQEESEPFLIPFTDDSSDPCETQVIIGSVVGAVLGLLFVCVTIGTIALGIIVMCNRSTRIKALVALANHADEKIIKAVTFELLETLGVSKESIETFCSNSAPNVANGMNQEVQQQDQDGITAITVAPHRPCRYLVACAPPPPTSRSKGTERKKKQCPEEESIQTMDLLINKIRGPHTG